MKFLVRISRNEEIAGLSFYECHKCKIGALDSLICTFCTEVICKHAPKLDYLGVKKSIMAVDGKNTNLVLRSNIGNCVAMNQILYQFQFITDRYFILGFNSD